MRLALVVALSSLVACTADFSSFEPIEGAGELVDALRASGVSVVLTTGFSPVTRDRLLDALGWTVDAALSPVDAGRGRPAPDLVLTALLRTRASSVAAVAVVGDTVSDVLSGRSAGAGLVVGVTTGAHTREQLLAAVIISSALGVTVFLFFGWLQNKAIGRWHNTDRNLSAR